MAEVSSKRRLGRIVICAALMAAVVVVGGRMVLSGVGTAGPQRLTGAGDTPSLEIESGPFRLAAGALTYQRTAKQASTRTLRQFYERRAYPGAPPHIPHRLLTANAWGGAACLSCHQDGGYAPEFKAMTPVTPHPELTACVQCHVAQSEGAGLFRASGFEGAARPALDQQSMPGSPPPIPHGLQMRGNCLACHAGPAAAAEIRTDHPERVNCRQCHAWNDVAVKAFKRGQP